MTLLDLSLPWLAALTLAAAIGLWFGLRILVTGASGWNSLIKSYRVQDLPEGERFRFASGSMGSGPMPVRYNNVLNIVVSASGFGIAMVSVLGRPPTVFIPWAEVESLVRSTNFFVDATVIRLRGQRAEISIYGAAGTSAGAGYSRWLAQRVR